MCRRAKYEVLSLFKRYFDCTEDGRGLFHSICLLVGPSTLTPVLTYSSTLTPEGFSKYIDPCSISDKAEGYPKVSKVEPPNSAQSE